MNTKKRIKYVVDIAMLLLLPALMAEMLMGQQLHEWIGVVSFLFFVAHHVLNARWWRSLLRGKYTPARCLDVIINLLLFADIAALMFSGVIMSGYVFAWLPISGGMLMARKLHLMASYWSMLLMSMHIGLHGGMMAGRAKKKIRQDHTESGIDGRSGQADAVETGSEMSIAARIGGWITGILGLGISAYGIYAFISQKIASYLFLQTHFVYYDETKSKPVFVAETLAMIVLFAVGAGGLRMLLVKIKCGERTQKLLKGMAFLIPVLICGITAVCVDMESAAQSSWGAGNMNTENVQENETETMSGGNGTENAEPTSVEDGFLRIRGGSFWMGSPQDEAWRVEDEAQHRVTVSDFYMSPYEVTQKEYAGLMGENPSNFSGEMLPVEQVSWLDAVAFCNAKSQKEGLAEAYQIDGSRVTWDRSANGYRLPTEAEWEYACRAGTTTPFYTENSPGADVCNFYGHYPYQIEENYFSQGNLETKPGEYRQTTVAVDSFSPNG